MPTSHTFGINSLGVNRDQIGVNKRGFTLVELLIVISIIAILSVIGMVIYSSVQKNARDARRVADIKSIQTALAVYKAQNGSYPSFTSSTTPAAGGWACTYDNPTTYIVGLGSFFSSGVLPIDPINNYSSGYYYCYYRYPAPYYPSPVAYNCSIQSTFYVLGIKTFESASHPTANFNCGGSYASGFAYTVGDFE